MLDIQQIATQVINDVGNEVLRRAESDKPNEVTERGSVEFFEGGFVIKYDGDMAAYYEFGTGTDKTVRDGNTPADRYLADKPESIQDEARLKFFKNGKGWIGAQPYIYPALLWALDEIPKRIKEEVVRVWSGLVFKK